MSHSEKTGKRWTEEELALISSARVASSKAIRTSKAMGLSVKVIHDNKIIEIAPDGSERVVRTLKSSKQRIPVIKKGVALKRK